jgi:hypothetical protein
VRLDVLEHLLGLREISSIPLSFEFFSFLLLLSLPSPLSPSLWYYTFMDRGAKRTISAPFATAASSSRGSSVWATCIPYRRVNSAR